MKKAVPLRTILITTLVFLALLHGVSSIPSICAAWREHQMALRVERLNQIENRLFQTVRNYGFERGRVNVVLNDAGPVDGMERNRAFILDRRKEGDQALNAALEGIPQHRLPDAAPVTADILDLREQIRELRERASHDMVRPIAERDRELRDQWFPAMTRLIKAVEELLVVVSRDISDRDGFISRLSSLKHRALALRNTAGPEMSILSATMLSGKPLSQSQRLKIERMMVETELNWEALNQLLVGIQDPDVASANENLKEIYFNDYAPKKEAVYPAALTGGPYPYTQQEFLGAGVKSLEAIAAFMDSVVAVTNEHAATKSGTAVRSLAMHSASLVISLILILAALFIVNNRVAVPIERMTRVMNRLANGDLDVRIPEAKRNDEIGEMTKAVQVFKRNAIQIEQDIVAIRNIESELRKSQGSLALAQQIANLGNWDYDVETNRMTWSDQVYRILGIRRGDDNSKSFDFMDLVAKEDRVRVRQYNDMVFKQFREQDLTYKINRKTGEERIIHENCEVRRNNEGKPIRIIGIIRDVTEQKQLEAQAQQAQKLESLGIVAGGIAHDFNNLLMGMMGNAELLMMDLPRDSEEYRHAEQIREIVVRASNISKQMLAYSGKGSFAIQPVDINELTRDLTNLIHATVSKKAALKLDLQEDLPTIDGDGAQINQIILNLLTNASESLEDQPGEITVRTYSVDCDAEDLRDSYLYEDQRPGKYVALEVTDTGIGMSEENLEKIFDPFFTTKFTGRGLGLASVLGIARGHKAAIRVKSEPGSGSQFTVLFPAGKLPKPTVKPETAPAMPNTLRGTVLVVDDEPQMRDVAAQLLARKGFHVLLAENGSSALEVYERRHEEISLVLLDMTMPDMNGDEVIRGMKQISDRVPVILSSGYGEEILAARFSKQDIAGFLEKPYRSQRLFELITGILGDRQRA